MFSMWEKVSGASMGGKVKVRVRVKGKVKVKVKGNVNVSGKRPGDNKCAGREIATKNRRGRKQEVGAARGPEGIASNSSSRCFPGGFDT
jgi:hypothetical protein